MQQKKTGDCLSRTAVEKLYLLVGKRPFLKETAYLQWIELYTLTM